MLLNGTKLDGRQFEKHLMFYSPTKYHKKNISNDTINKSNIERTIVHWGTEWSMSYY